MLNTVKLALRISHNYLDDEINSTIKASRAEMVRSGIAENKANSEDDDLIIQAIKTYCLAMYCNDSKRAEKYAESWTLQLDNLRKSSVYNRDGDTDV